ncbi:uncharacterized protein [Dermacentor andersoni]|uniref:uncharacterized protein n=1 Tax=Dermacentor andersoni TaxID=34620 RepID=UPI003B3A28FE
MDLFHLNGQTIILVVDYYSRFHEVVTLRSTTAQAVIDALKSIIARHGIPQEVSYRDTPGVDGFSPAQLLMGRQLRTRVPKQDFQLRPNLPPTKDVVAKDVAYKQKQADSYNRHHGARDLKPLQTGQRFWVRPDQMQATVLSPGQRPRSYVVETERGGTYSATGVMPFGPTASGEEPPPLQQVRCQEPQPANIVESTVPLGKSVQQSPAARDRSDGVTRTRDGGPVTPPRRLNL